MKKRIKTSALFEEEIDRIAVAQADDDSARGKSVKVRKKASSLRALMRVLNYRILLRKEPEGGYTVIVPSLPGCITYGETIENAIKMAKEAIELYLESLIAHGDEIPTEEGTLEYTLTVEAYA
jgi:predicted RNase H-like HicB family nuclease